MKNLKTKIHIIAQELFQYSLLIYLSLLVVESLQEGFVSYYFNASYVLWIVLASGSAIVLTYTRIEEQEKLKKITGNEMANCVFFAIAGSYLVYTQTKHIGLLALPITGITFFIILFLSYLILLDHTEKK